MPSDSLVPSVVAAAPANAGVSHPQVRLLPLGPPREANRLAPVQLWLRQAVAEMLLLRYKTNDILVVPSGFAEALDAPTISVNSVSLDLARRERAVIFLLADHGRRLGQNPALFGHRFPVFLSVSGMLRELEAAKKNAGSESFWQNAIYTDIHKTISRLRRKLSRAGLNRNLIEGQRGVGYRLSTPHWNLIAPIVGEAPAGSEA